MSSMHQKGYMPWDRNGNRLLLQSELGKNKASIYDLPEESFVYGKLTYDDPEKANELIYKWKEHNNSVNANQGKVKDLIETNKKCITNQLHTASHFYQFRKTNTHFQTPREGSTQIKMVLPEESHAYGKPLDLQDPIRLVMANNYGENDKISRHSFYQTQSNKSSLPRKLSCHITKNHNLLKEATEKRLEKFNWNKKSELWKISRFGNVEAKVKANRKGEQSNEGISRVSQKGSNSTPIESMA